jgi:hypothetical protein
MTAIRIYVTVRALLIALFGTIFVAMLYVTVSTSLRMPIWDAFATFGDNPWAVATLWDAYFGFLTFYVWLVWRETRMAPRIIWFVLVMALGNIAMSLYVLIQLWKLSPGQSPSLLFTSRNESLS